MNRAAAGAGGLIRVYGWAVALLPARFRDAHAEAMVDLVRERIGDAVRDRGHAAAVAVWAGELTDTLWTCLWLRVRPATRRGVAVGAGAVAVMAGLGLGLGLGLDAGTPDGPGFRAPAPPPPGARAEQRIDFNATDPAGEFTLSLAGRTVLGATVDRIEFPLERVVLRGDSIRFLSTDGTPLWSVHYDPRAGRIEWAARPAAETAS